MLAARGGAQKTVGLEPPFVGRDRELRLVKEVFHSSAEEGKAQLVSVVGTAGLGKSRFAWEFEKYVDGLADLFWWHRGRCLAYGEGVAYWALAEMVRMRAGILEEEAPEPALAKLRASIEEHVADEEERAWLEPRLAHLLGLAERTAPDREDLFSAWRLFFERLAEQRPVVLIFEDLHWADAGLLDFIEYLLEWSRSHALFVLALARPDLLERRPTFGAGGRNATTLSLEPLSERAMGELLDGFVPGLPDELRGQVLGRAEGVPLYAVETVRMLLDRGLLERHGDFYRPTGEIGALDVPETLHALVAARLDGLTPEERRLLQDAAVLGKSFMKSGLSALSTLSEPELEPVLTSLVRKEVLSVQADPRSPERGQYNFVQDLLKHVAYETLAKSERKTRHLAAAAYLVQAFGAGEQEIVEVIAAHYLDAYRAAPDADDAAEIKAKALEMLTRAGERAASLAANEEAQHYFERAAELADDPLAEAGAARARRGDSLGGRASGGGTRAVRARARGLRDPEPDAPRRTDLRSSRGGRMAERPSRGGTRADGAGLRGPVRRRAGCGPGDARSRARTTALLQGRDRSGRAPDRHRDRDRGIALAAGGVVAGPQHAGPDHRLRRALGAVARAVQARARARARARPHRRGPARLQQSRRSARPAGPVRGGDRAAAAGARARAQGRLPRERVAADRRVERLPVPDRPVGRGAGARIGGSRGTAQPNRDCRRQHADLAGRRAR